MRGKPGYKKMTTTTERLEEFRALYLEDLEKTVAYDEKVRQRVYNIDAWKALPTNISKANTNTPAVVIPGTTHDTWVWSDQHLFHKNIIRFCDRPFPTAELMNQCLVGNYNNVVKPDDVCIWVGDVGFAGDDKINEVIKQMNGYKILIIGNHDFHHGKIRKLAFDEIHLLYYIQDDDAEIIMTHYPMDNLPLHTTNVHGHIHQNVTGNDQHINVSVERIGYKPINIKEILTVAHKRAAMYG